MTIAQAAEYLQVSVASLYQYAQKGMVPALKIGRHWRFRRDALVAISPRFRAVGSSPSGAKVASRALHVAVVDDDEGIGKLLTKWIQQAGHQVTLLTSGAEVAGALQRGRCDLILLDLVLTDGTASDVLAGIPEKLRPPVVLITGNAGSPHLDDALEHSISYVLNKPFSREDILGVLKFANNPSDPEPREPVRDREPNASLPQ